MPRALVIGSGVAGPAVASLLREDGWEVHLYEAAPEPDDARGAFLNVATNGLSVLEALGARESLLEDAHPCPHMVMWSSTGKRLGSVPNGPAGEPARGSAVVRRAWLHQVLHQAAERRDIPTTFGARLTAVDQTADHVRATFSSGRVAEGDLLIGCDGIGSITRRHIDDRAPAPAYSGLVGLGGIVEADLEPTPGTQHFVFGRRSFFGYLVRADQRVYWFANLTSPEPDRATLRQVTTAEWLDRLRDLHRDDPFPVPEILASHQGELGGYPIYDLNRVPHWSRGRVVALGDAVHPTSPSAGQGASLALEDAQVLARCLRDQPAYGSAFAQYQAERQPRTDRVVDYARKIDSRKRVSRTRLGIAVRDAMLPHFLKAAADDRSNDWLYNYRADVPARATRIPG